jgi:hypothetical protein
MPPQRYLSFLPSLALVLLGALALRYAVRDWDEPDLLARTLIGETLLLGGIGATYAVARRSLLARARGLRFMVYGLLGVVLALSGLRGIDHDLRLWNEIWEAYSHPGDLLGELVLLEWISWMLVSVVVTFVGAAYLWLALVTRPRMPSQVR